MPACPFAGVLAWGSPTGLRVWSSDLAVIRNQLPADAGGAAREHAGLTEARHALGAVNLSLPRISRHGSCWLPVIGGWRPSHGLVAQLVRAHA